MEARFMGRKADYTQEELNGWLNKYLVEKCNSDTALLSIPKLGQYLRENGVDIADYTLRRNLILRNKIDEYKNNFHADLEEIVFGYKTLDVDLFLNNNTSKSALKESLIALDNTYNRSMIAAMQFAKENKKFKTKNEELKEKNDELENELKVVKDDLEDDKKQLLELKRENQKLKRLIKDYVYPEIANELLKQEGIVFETAGIVKEDAVQDKLVREETDIKKIVLKSSLTQKLLGDI